MNEIKFNCPHCGQSLAVDTASAGMTVACPQCGQMILVPQMARPMARLAQSPAPAETPKSAKWAWIVAGIGVIALCAAGVLVWQTHRRAGVQAMSARANSPSLTPEMLNEKRFQFSWKSEKKGNGTNGIAVLHSDGSITGINPRFWLIDGQGRLVLKYQDGSVSVVFTQAELRDGKWFFAGMWSRDRSTEQLLEELGPETAGNAPAQRATPNQPNPADAAAKLKAKWTGALNNALSDLQNNNDPESANFVSSMIASFDSPDGLAPAAIAADGDRIRARIRELVQRHALESATTLQEVLYYVFPLRGNNATGPANPNHRISGAPGPGGLVLYLPLDKPDQNGIVRDQSGAGNDGQVFGARWVPDGKFGGAYQFHTTNLTDRIVISNSDTLNPDFITIAAWIKTDKQDGFWSRIVDKDYRNAYCFALGGDYKDKANRGKLDFEISGGGMTSTRFVGDNQWHQVASTFDGQTMRCYVDGEETSRRVGRSGPLRKTSWDLCIGNSVVGYGTGEFLGYDGLITGLRIYNRALSAAEVKSLSAAAPAGLGATAAPGN